MKTAIYIEDGVVQLVLTPENVFEEKAIRSFEDKPMDAKIMSGSFYDCRGGWIRQADIYYPTMGCDSNKKSLIIRSDKEDKINEST